MIRVLVRAAAGATLLAGVALAPAAASAAPRPCTITGTAGNDSLRGTPGDDVICGGPGDDRIDGGGGDDVIRGGPGDDRLAGGAGDDRIEGGAGHDVLVDDAGDDTLVRTSGDDDTVKKLGDYRVASNVTFSDMAGVTVTASQGSPSNCTRDEEYGTFTLDPGQSAVVRGFSMTVKDGGWCAVQPSHNAWKLTFAGGGSGQMEINDKGWEAPYQMRCLSGWTGPYMCSETKTSGSRYAVTIRPKG